MVVLLDLDEVLADFVGGALAAHRWTRERLNTVWQPGQWSIVEPMGLTVQQFWAPINNAGEKFWIELQPTPWMQPLVHTIQAMVGEAWYIVTSPSSNRLSWSGKLQWIHDHFGSQFDRVVFTAHKYLLANPQSILVDDRQETIERFMDYGGRGITFPSRHNYLHLYAVDPVGYVSKQLKAHLEHLQCTSNLGT